MLQKEKFRFLLKQYFMYFRVLTTYYEKNYNSIFTAN